MVSLKEVMENEIASQEWFLPGNACCAGCGLEIALRWAMKALGPNVAMITPASCLNVVIGLWPKAAPKFSQFNMAFAAGAAAATGIAAAFDAKAYRFPGKVWDDMISIVFAGDGGTTDIGIQGISGAAERDSNILYVCYDNEAYMNTGIQRSSSTPHGAITTTTPFGKQRFKKNLPAIVAAHDVPYVATCSVSHPLDIYEKFIKAKEINGFRYIHIFAPCPPGWGYPSEDTIQISKLAVDTGFWPLYEIDQGKFILSKPSKKCLDPSKRKNIMEYLKNQKRFSQLSEDAINYWQENIKKTWKQIIIELEIQENNK